MCCLMIEEVIRFNTWDAFNRAYLRVITNYGDKQIHGQIYLPAHYTFKSWEEFNEAIKEIKKLGEKIREVLMNLHSYGTYISNNLKIGYPDSNDNDALPSVYGEIHVEITDPWIRRW